MFEVLADLFTFPVDGRKTNDEVDCWVGLRSFSDFLLVRWDSESRGITKFPVVVDNLVGDVLVDRVVCWIGALKIEGQKVKIIFYEQNQELTTVFKSLPSMERELVLHLTRYHWV